jgi:putative transposase
MAAYVLMTNHIHMLVTPEQQNSISLMMQTIGRFYVPYINHTYGSSGTAWEEHYKAQADPVRSNHREAIIDTHK